MYIKSPQLLSRDFGNFIVNPNFGLESENATTKRNSCKMMLDTPGFRHHGS